MFKPIKLIVFLALFLSFQARSFALDHDLYYHYLMDTIDQGIRKDIDFRYKGNWKIKVLFEESNEGIIHNIYIYPLNQDAPDQLTHLIGKVLQEISPLKPLPASIAKFHNGSLNKERFEYLFSNGDDIFNWLVKNYILQKKPNGQYGSVTVTDEIKKLVSKQFPKNSDGIMHLLNTYDLDLRWTIIVDFRARFFFHL